MKTGGKPSQCVRGAVVVKECIFNNKSAGRKVYRGYLDGAEVAAKTFWPLDQEAKTYELDILKSLPQQENVIRGRGVPRG